MKLQRVQNKAIKFAVTNDNDNPSIEEAHHKYKIDPYNIRLYNRGIKLWEKFCLAEPELTTRSLQENENHNTKDHYWWRRIASLINVPEPIYT